MSELQSIDANELYALYKKIKEYLTFLETEKEKLK